MTTRANKASAKPATAKKSRFSFFAEVVGELRKVRWPTRQEALRLTILVLVVCIVLGAILGGFDWAFAKLFGILVGY